MRFRLWHHYPQRRLHPSLVWCQRQRWMLWMKVLETIKSCVVSKSYYAVIVENMTLRIKLLKTENGLKLWSFRKFQKLLSKMLIYDFLYNLSYIYFFFSLAYSFYYKKSFGSRYLNVWDFIKSYLCKYICIFETLRVRIYKSYIHIYLHSSY